MKMLRKILRIFFEEIRWKFQKKKKAENFY